MAVQEQTPLQEYTANGIAKQFDLEFDCESADHLIVSIDDLEVLHTDWYLSGNAIMFHVAPANGKQVKIQRNTPFSRIADYQSYNNSFRPPAINKDFDRIWWKLQELGVADWILSNRISALKAYVDQQDSELQQNIDNLKTYVDDKDDELRAYLVEEIRKQGVALDQLDDYYNYLMERLAQIAVDKGWDASFVVDGNETQKQINDKTIQSVETINDLKNLTPRMNGQMVYVKGFRSGSKDGCGYFEWDENSTETEVEGFVVKTNSLLTGRFKRILIDHRINVLDAGAYRDGLTETHTHIKAALNYSISLNIPCYAPSGTYLLGNRVDPTLTTGSSVYFYGDGIDQTIFKERDGLTAQIGRYNMSFYFSAPTGITINSIVLRDFKVDKNGHTSMLTQAVIDAKGIYEYEQAHCLGISTAWTNAKIKLCIIENIETTDKIGAGICFMSGVIDKVVINNISGSNFLHNGGERGDFEFQAAILDLSVDNSRGSYIQCEPDVAEPPNSVSCKAVFSNSNYDVTEFTSYRSAPKGQAIELSNHTSNKKLTLRNLKAAIKDSSFTVSNDTHDYWSGMVDGSYIEDSEITVRIDTVNNRTMPFYVRSSLSSGFPSSLTIRGGVIKPESTVNSTTTGFAIQNTTFNNGSTVQKIVLEGVVFDPRFQSSVDCYANGEYEIRRCKLASRAGSAAIIVGGHSSYYSTVVLDSNDLSQVVGAYVQYTASNNLWSVEYTGVHDYSKANFSAGGSTTTGTIELRSKSTGVFTSDSVPTGKGIKGWRVKINKPEFGVGSEFICTTTHSAASVYQLSAQAGVKMDTTANRPSGLTTASRGLRYLDTTLAAGGKPIQYNGTAWVDSLGTSV